MNLEKFQDFHNMYQEIDAILREIFELVIDYYYCDGDMKTSPTKNATVSYWYPYEGDVEIAWTETWNYGGYSEGYCSIPFNLLLDKDLLINETKLKKERLKKEKEEKERNDESLKAQRDIAELKRLNEKYKIFYGGDSNV